MRVAAAETPHCESGQWGAARATEILVACARAAHTFELTVTGRCMEPLLREGSRVVLRPRSARAPRWGDVVLTVQGDRVRLHRLIWRPVWSRRWRTMADRARCLDPAIAPEDVLATVVEEGDDGREARSRPGVALRALVRAARSRWSKA